MKLRDKIIDTLKRKNKEYKIIQNFIDEESFINDDELDELDKILGQVNAQIKILEFILSNY